jgi:hypothetical protein
MKSLLAGLLCLASLLTLPNFADEWRRVYLTCYPRSGSHWARYLIEEVTNIATSSVYQDKDEPLHLRTPFAWGGYCPNQGYEGTRLYPQPGQTVVIKTHYPAIYAQRFDLKAYAKAIRIVRHPVESIYSYYIYRKNAKKKPLSSLLQNYIRTWRKYQEYWSKQENVLTVRYEDLFSAPGATLAQIMQAIGYEYRFEDIERAINRYPPQGELKKHYVHFSESDLELITQQLGDLMEQFDYR